MNITPSQFLNTRSGAADSDVEALMKEFGLTEKGAAEIYYDWLCRDPIYASLEQQSRFYEANPGAFDAYRGQDEGDQA